MISVIKKLYLMGWLLVGFGYILAGAHRLTANHLEHKNCQHRHPKAHEVSQFCLHSPRVSYLFSPCLF